MSETAKTAAGPELVSALITDVGRRREVNEDAGLDRFPCYLVADGMGGHAAGDVASRTAIETFASRVPEGRRSSVTEVSEALEAARIAVDDVSAEHPRGAGCTLSGAVLVDHDGAPYWLVLNVGDSRVYLHRGSELKRLTVDHSLLEEMRGAGMSEHLPPRNIITRALGSADSAPDSWLVPVEAGTRLLVCSDGLTTEVEDEEIRAVLSMGGRADAVVRELVDRANAAGGQDNITVLLVDVLSNGAERAGASAGDGGLEHTADSTLTVTRPGRGRR